jgi:hypothetical protein
MGNDKMNDRGLRKLRFYEHEVHPALRLTRDTPPEGGSKWFNVRASNTIVVVATREKTQF